jgi:hypothetical protein
MVGPASPALGRWDAAPDTVDDRRGRCRAHRQPLPIQARDVAGCHGTESIECPEGGQQFRCLARGCQLERLLLWRAERLPRRRGPAPVPFDTKGILGRAAGEGVGRLTAPDQVALVLPIPASPKTRTTEPKPRPAWLSMSCSWQSSASRSSKRPSCTRLKQTMCRRPTSRNLRELAAARRRRPANYRVPGRRDAPEPHRLVHRGRGGHELGGVQAQDGRARRACPVQADLHQRVADAEPLTAGSTPRARRPAQPEGHPNPSAAALS